jgi:hypothetical protein
MLFNATLSIKELKLRKLPMLLICKRFLDVSKKTTLSDGNAIR